MTCRGHIHNGTIVLKTPPNLPEGTEVDVQVTPVPDSVRKRQEKMRRIAERINYDFDAFWQMREASKL